MANDRFSPFLSGNSDVSRSFQQLSDETDAALTTIETTVGVGFLGAKVAMTGTVSIPNGTATAIPLNSEIFDYGGFWSSGTALIVPTGGAGMYSIKGACKFLASGTVDCLRKLAVLINGTTPAGSSEIPVDSDEAVKIECSGLVFLNEGDEVEVTVETGVATANDIYDAGVFMYRVGTLS